MDEKFMIGTDIEGAVTVFLKNAIPEFSAPSFLVPPSILGLGDKKNKKKLQACEIHQDNAFLEINVPPGSSPQEFHQNCVHAHSGVLNWLRNQGARKIREFLPKGASLYDIQLRFGSVHHLEPLFLKERTINIFGCAPEFNAYTGHRCQSPDPEGMVIPQTGQTYRTAGGHVHIGCPNLSEEERINLVKLLDIFLTLPYLTKMAPKLRSWDKDPLHEEAIRRKSYGGAGAYRLTEYPNGMSGVEYRTLGPDWFPRLSSWVAHITFQVFNDRKYLEDKYLAHTDSLKLVQHTINNWSDEGDCMQVAKQIRSLEPDRISY